LADEVWLRVLKCVLLPYVESTFPFIPAVPSPTNGLASFRPRGNVHLDRRVDFLAICSGTLL
jgi:hypothetical protein